MIGLDIITKYALISDKVRWDVNDYDFKDLVSTLSEKDKELILTLDKIGDGELTGVGMLKCLFELMSADPQKLYSVFYEVIMYAVNVIIYEEYRHGLVLKSLVHEIKGNDNFINTIDGEFVASQYINLENIWKTPYETLISFLFGEVTNTLIYREASRMSESEELKKLLSNISSDEYRHKCAWRDISHKICQDTDNCVHFIEAFKNSHMIHQAEIGSKYTEGVQESINIFNLIIMKEIHEEKLKLIEYITGYVPDNSRALLLEHINHAKGIVNE